MKTFDANNYRKNDAYDRIRDVCVRHPDSSIDMVFEGNDDLFDDCEWVEKYPPIRNEDELQKLINEDNDWKRLSRDNVKYRINYYDKTIEITVKYIRKEH